VPQFQGVVPVGGVGTTPVGKVSVTVGCMVSAVPVSSEAVSVIAGVPPCLKIPRALSVSVRWYVLFAATAVPVVSVVATAVNPIAAKHVAIATASARREKNLGLFMYATSSF
jgi:hypothetical protein